MMKNLPNRYKEVLRKISNMEGFVGLVDDTTLGGDGILYGTICVVFENHDIVDKDKYFELVDELYLCGSEDEFDEPCRVYPLTVTVARSKDTFISKENLLKEIGE